MWLELVDLVIAGSKVEDDMLWSVVHSEQVLLGNNCVRHIWYKYFVLEYLLTRAFCLIYQL